MNSAREPISAERDRHILHQAILRHAVGIGTLLESAYPRATDPEPCIPREFLEAISEEVTFVVAEILQAFIDAGSERDATLEELYQPIHDHLRGFSSDV